MKKRSYICCAIFTALFITSLMCSLFTEIESFDVTSGVFGVMLGFNIVYIICLVNIETLIKRFCKKIELDVVSKEYNELSDYNKPVYIAYNYAKEMDKEYTEEEMNKIKSALYDIGASNVNTFKETKHINRKTYLLIKIMEYYKREKSNRFETNFFVDSNENFLAYGISICLGIVGTGLMIGGGVYYNALANPNHGLIWLLMISGVFLVIPLVSKLLVALGIK